MTAPATCAPPPAVVHGTVADMPDEVLLRRVMLNACRPVKRGGQPRWVRVADLFALGSTYATQLCRRFGLDPDERVAR